MPRFLFKALTSDDSVVQGRLDAPTVGLAEMRLLKTYKKLLSLTDEDGEAAHPRSRVLFCLVVAALLGVLVFLFYHEI